MFKESNTARFDKNVQRCEYRSLRFARGRDFAKINANSARGGPVLGVIGAPLLALLRAPYCELSLYFLQILSKH